MILNYIYIFIIVTIYGDTTSDDATTETDDIQVPLIAPISTAQHLSSLRPTVRLNGNKLKLSEVGGLK